MTFKVLIVDDVVAAAELLRATLVESGLVSDSPEDCRVALSAHEARLELLKYRPDLLILDEVLPGESVIDLLEDRAFSSIPVILVSASAEFSRPLVLNRLGPLLGRVSKWDWKEMKVAAQRLADIVGQKAPRKQG